jgi:hypothetical protein
LVFEKLATFIADGHSLVLIRGNHDMDFHWTAAREAFVEAIHDCATVGAAERLSQEFLADRVQFYPWFYYVEGLLYVEHGHQFDAMCNYPRLLAPLSPADPSRLNWSFSDWLLRMVVGPTPGLGQDGHESKGVFDYLRFGLSIGIVGGLRLAYRFIRAISMAIRRSRLQFSEAAMKLRSTHERRMSKVASQTRVKVEKVRELATFWPTPVTSGIFRTLRSVFVDRIIGALLLCGLGLTSVVVGLNLWWSLGLCTGALGLFYLYTRWAGRHRARDVSAEAAQLDGARRIAKLLPTRWIVMGHTHTPRVQPLDERTTYVNLGHWGVDDLDHPGATAPCTHMVLRIVAGQPIAEFLRWDPVLGPMPTARFSET